MKRRRNNVNLQNDTDITTTTSRSSSNSNSDETALLNTDGQALPQQYHPHPAIQHLLSSRSLKCVSLFNLVVVLSIYWYTTYPSISGGDSGELVVSACLAGVGHPPGYSTFIILNHLLLKLLSAVSTISSSLLSLDLLASSPAYAVNLFSALCGALAATLYGIVAALLSGDPACAIFTAFGFAFSPTVWLYAIQGEVFALNNLIVGALALCTVLFYESENQLLSYHIPHSIYRKKDLSLKASSKVSTSSEAENNKAFSPAPASVSSPILSSSSPSNSAIAAARARSFLASKLLFYGYMGAFISGLCITNQHTTIFYLLPTIPLVLASLHYTRLLNLKSIRNLFLLFIVGLSPYLFVIIRAHAKVKDSWGDQRTISGFLVHLFRQEYGTFQLAATDVGSGDIKDISHMLRMMITRLTMYLRILMQESLYITPILSIIGVITATTSKIRSVRLSSLLFVYSYFVYILIFHYLANLDLRPLFLGVQARFWQQPNSYVFIFASIGLKKCVDLIFSRAHSGSRVHLTRSIGYTSTFKQLTTLLFGLLFATAQLRANWYHGDHHSTNIFHTSAVKILDSFPQNAIVLLNGDLNNNILKYVQECEHHRHDVQLLSLQLMTWPWFVPMQQENYPTVVFPGNRYHVNYAGAFNMKQFLDANKKFPIFLCGPYKEGDHSLDRRPDSPGNKYYLDWPYGLCSRLLPSSRPPRNLTSLLRDGLSGLVRLDEMPPFDDQKCSEETWENVLYLDAFRRLVYLTSYASYHSNQQPSDSSLLTLAYELTDEIFGTSAEASFANHSILSDQDYRSAGVIYGQYSVLLQSKFEYNGSKYCTKQMIRVWKEFVNRNPGDKEISGLLSRKTNPYTGQPLDEESELP